MSVNDKKAKKMFGDAVRKYRLKIELSQEQLADESGLHRTYISDIERGGRNVSIVNIMRLAEALKIKPSQLIKELD